MSHNVVGRRNLRNALEHKAAAHPAKTFVIYEENEQQQDSFTYEQFNQMVNRTANGLNQLGIKKGDKVNLHLTNCPEFLFFWLATAKIGAVMVPTNPLSPPDEVQHPVHHSESVVSVTQPNLLSTVQAIR